MCRNRVRSDKEMVGTGIVCKLESIAFLTFLSSLFCIFICKLIFLHFILFFFQAYIVLLVPAAKFVKLTQIRQVPKHENVICDRKNRNHLQISLQ